MENVITIKKANVGNFSNNCLKDTYFFIYTHEKTKSKTRLPIAMTINKKEVNTLQNVNLCLSVMQVQGFFSGVGTWESQFGLLSSFSLPEVNLQPRGRN